MVYETPVVSCADAVTSRKSACDVPLFPPAFPNLSDLISILASMNKETNYSEWLAKWGDAYSTDAERQDAYREHQAKLAEMREVFDLPAD